MHPPYFCDTDLMRLQYQSQPQIEDGEFRGINTFSFTPLLGQDKTEWTSWTCVRHCFCTDCHQADIWAVQLFMSEPGEQN
jgi:hypothetical protein